jgi:hypothetical protein
LQVQSVSVAVQALQALVKHWPEPQQPVPPNVHA